VSELFNNSKTDGINNKNIDRYIPLAKRLQPMELEEFYGQDKLTGKHSILRRLIDQDKHISCIFYGPPGSGKSALARIIAHKTKSDFIPLNAVTARVEDLRKAFIRAEGNRGRNIRTILFIDEIHRFNKMQQDGLLPALEEGLVTLIGTTTRNPYYSLIPPLRSRVLLFSFEKLSTPALNNILQSAIKKENLIVEKDAVEYLISFANGDARRMLNLLETAMASEGKRISKETLVQIIDKQALLYDRDEDFHYDIISAFIKSVRGSDPDAALYWLARMLEGGEDPLFIARRLIILASEDIGLADRFSLILAEAAYRAVDKIGMPEARIILSHVTIYLTLQPKSNSSYLAIEKATEYVKTKNSQEVPPYLRASHPSSKDYKYPHDFKYHYIKQDYMKEKVKFYQPDKLPLGEEKELKRRLDFFNQLREKGKNEGL